MLNRHAKKPVQIRTQKGAAMVEFAIVLPLLCVLIFGMIDVGLILKDSLALSHLAKGAARSYALTSSAGEGDIRTSVSTSATALGLKASGVTVVFLNPDTEHAGVTLTYTHETIAGNLIGFDKEITLSGTGIHRKE